MKEVLKKEIKVLNFSESINEKLVEREINFVHELCKHNRKSLKEYGFKASEINDIMVKLQLQGLDLGKKYKLQ